MKQGHSTVGLSLHGNPRTLRVWPEVLLLSAARLVIVKRSFTCYTYFTKDWCLCCKIVLHRAAYMMGTCHMAMTFQTRHYFCVLICPLVFYRDNPISEFFPSSGNLLSVLLSSSVTKSTQLIRLVPPVVQLQLKLTS